MKRTKKLLVGFLAALSVLSGSLGLAACGGDESSLSVSNSSTQQSSASSVSSETASSSGEEDNSDEEVGAFSQGLKYTLLDDDTYEVTGIGDCTDTEIVIPSRYNGKAVTSIGSYAFSGCSRLMNVVIPESVMSIGYRTFVGASLQFNEYGNGKYLGSKTNDYFALIEATSTDLSGFSIHNDTKVIADSAFSNCDSSTYNIKNNLKYVGTKQNHYLYLAGVNDTSIASATIENTCKFIGYEAFRSCSSLTSIVIPDSVTSIGNYAFYSCRSLTSIEIGDSVTSIGDMAFYDCDSLTSVYITDIEAWCNISGLANLMVVASSNKKLYLNNELITGLIIPDSVISIGVGAFCNCDSLTSIEIPDSVISIGVGAFCNCDSLTSIEIPDSVISVGTGVFYGCSSLTSVEIGDSVTSIGDYAFSDCDSLTSVVIGDSVTSIGDRAFYSCDNLTSIEIPDSVTSIGDYAFCYCGSLTSIIIPDSVTSIGDYAFCYCGSLTSVAIPDSVTSIGDYAFCNCRRLTSVTIPDSVTSIDAGAFYNCKKLVEVVNKSPHITITKGSTANGFVGYQALAVYNSGDTFESKLSNDNGYIVYTDGEEKILVGYTGTETDLTLPSYITKIYQYAFYECTSLTSVVIGDSVTTIGDYAFAGCTSLTSVVIGDSVTSIGSEAFSGCYSLTSITFNGTKAQWNAIETGYDWIYNVPAEKVVCSDGE